MISLGNRLTIFLTVGFLFFWTSRNNAAAQAGSQATRWIGVFKEMGSKEILWWR
jgi:hypothetical protein